MPPESYATRTWPKTHTGAEAVLAWQRAAAARGWAERSAGWQRAQELTSLAGQVSARRVALEQVAEARQAGHEATEDTRQRALAADTELRRRHPGIDLPPLHPEHEQGADIATQAAWPEGLSH
jgi:hypothetical protein